MRFRSFGFSQAARPSKCPLPETDQYLSFVEDEEAERPKLGAIENPKTCQQYRRRAKVVIAQRTASLDTEAGMLPIRMYPRHCGRIMVGPN
jgi:hypothetical protein